MIMMIVGGFLETLSVSLVIPFIGSIMDSESFMNNSYVSFFCHWLGVKSSTNMIVFLSLLLAVIFVLKNVYLLVEYNTQYKFVYGNMFMTQRNVLNKLLFKPYSFFLRISSGEVIRIVNSDVSEAYILLSIVLQIFTEVVVSGMLIITVFIIAPEATIIMALTMFALVMVIDRVIHPIIRKLGIDDSNAKDGMNKWLIQSVQGIKEVKVMKKEDFFLKNYEQAGQIHAYSNRKQDVLCLFPRFIIESFCMSAGFVLIAMFVYFGGGIDTILPIVSAFAMAALRILPSANRISAGMVNISYFETRLDNMISILADIDDDAQNRYSTEEIAPLRQKVIEKRDNNGIVLEDISFCYEGADKDVLNKANMIIKEGESVGIIGESGAGKTTIVDIVLGLLKPYSGVVLVDGKDIKDIYSDWLEQIGYIPQMIFMLDDTIRNNVAFGEEKSTISDEAIWKALDEAALSDYIKSLPQGLDTQIGERGVRLSGGQRQRIGIARALYHDPAVLIFDEATSALDNETEAAIMDSVNNLQGKKTMIIIAHRLTTIEKCDKVYRIENGKAIRIR